jgi:hypothetical protein
LLDQWKALDEAKGNKSYTTLTALYKDGKGETFGVTYFLDCENVGNTEAFSKEIPTGIEPTTYTLSR